MTRVYISSSSIPRTLITPKLSGIFEYSKESDKVYYSHEMADTMRINTPADFALVNGLEDDCEEVTVEIQTLCGTEYSEYWRGYFTLYPSVDKDEDLCYIDVKPKPLDDYKCFDAAIKDIYNAYPTSFVTVTSIGGTYETRICNRTISGGGFDEFYDAQQSPYSDCLTEPTEWAVLTNKLEVNGVDYTGTFPYNEEEPFDIQQTVTWHREVIDIPCSDGLPAEPPFGDSWDLISDDCATDGTAKYWRAPVSSSTVLGDYTRGTLLSTVITRAITSLSCGLTVKSDFFNINPEGDAPSNIAYTFAEAYLHNLTFHQKSDIKNKNASNPSTSAAWEFKVSELIEDLRRIFNVRPKIVDDVLIIEHVSFFTSSAGRDLTGSNLPKKISYTSGEAVKTQKYLFADEESSYAFKSREIQYTCGDSDKDEQCVLFSTDLAYMEDETNTDRISNEGFVLISTAVYDGKYIIIDGNSPLSWPTLHANLHLHGRLYRRGKLNDVEQDFLTWVPYKSQASFAITLCCGEQFDPSETIATYFGTGYVKKATENIYTKSLKLELNY